MDGTEKLGRRSYVVVWVGLGLIRISFFYFILAKRVTKVRGKHCAVSLYPELPHSQNRLCYSSACLM